MPESGACIDGEAAEKHRNWRSNPFRSALITHLYLKRERGFYLYALILKTAHILLLSLRKSLG